MTKETYCPNYLDIAIFLADPKNSTDINRKIETIGDCMECSESGLCELWVTCLFIDNLAPRLEVPTKEIGIKNLDEYLKKIAFALLERKDYIRNKDAVESKRVFSLRYFENLIPLRAKSNNKYIKSNLQKAFDAFHQEDYETAVLLLRMLLSDSNELQELNLYTAVSYFFGGNYENAITFMNYYSEKSYRYDIVMANAFVDLCFEKIEIISSS